MTAKRIQRKCGFVLKQGQTGESVDDETPSVVCLKPAAWSVSRPGVRARYRCDAHVHEYRELQAEFADMTIEPVQ